MPTTPQIVVFDLGKVLLDFDYSIAIRRIGARSTATAEQLTHLISHTQLLVDYEKGLLTSRQFYEEIRRSIGFQGDFPEFASLFGDIFTPILPMIELHSAIRRSGISTYIFSNTNELAVNYIRDRFPFFGEFDGYILSYEVQAMKPEPAIYESLEKRSGKQGNLIFYLDDRPENIAAAANRGWQVHLHDSPRDAHLAARALGLLPPP